MTADSVALSVDQVATEVVNKIFSFNWQIIFKVIMIIIVVQILLYVGDSIFSYLKFRMNQHIQKGSRVIYNGETGIIKKVGVFTIVIETDHGWLPISTKDWGKQFLIKLKDCNRVCEFNNNVRSDSDDTP